MVEFFFSDETRRNPFPWYEEMRRTSPVFHSARTGTWMLFDYESVRRAMSDHESFSSRVVPPGGKAPEWLVFLDPPRHSAMRAIVSRAFTPRAIAALEPRMVEISARLLDAVVEQGAMDLVEDYASPLPVMVIADMFGVSARDLAKFTRWSRIIVNLSYSIAGGAEAQRAAMEYFAVKEEIREYLDRVIADRRETPSNDLVSQLVHAQIEGARLTNDEILGFFQLLLSAATETTTNLIDNAMLCLLEHPEALRALRSDADLLPGAIEEVVRFRSPGQAMFRQTTREVALGDRLIPANSFVLVMVGSANRDPKAFAEPDRFDIRRSPNPHVGFGHGIHYCLGAALARLEARVALKDLLSRLDEVALDGDEPWEPRAALHVHGPTRLPLRFRAVAAR